MKTFLGLLSLAFLTSVGCVNLAGSKLKEEGGPMAMKPAAPVTAEQVSSENAHAITRSLWDELDQEDSANSPASKGTARNKK